VVADAAVFAATHATKSCAVIDVVQSATSHSFLLTIGAMKKLKWANSLATTIKGDGFANVTYGCAKFMGNVAEDAVVKVNHAFLKLLFNHNVCSGVASDEL